MGKSVRLFEGLEEILVLHPLPLLGIMKWDPRGSLQPDHGARDFLSRNNSSPGRKAAGYGESWAKGSSGVFLAAAC